ncbi:MAG: plasmid pRiA4b ORF-3 family protein [Actinophytocola sp.]|nr:plasmid pRiA4b ORF-3 family protein [Actinophytocola sp.]
MSSAKRSRKTGKAVLRPVPDPPQECDCPECTGEIDPDQVLDQLLAGVRDVLTADGALDAEVMAATFLAMAQSADSEFEEALTDGLIPALEQHATSEALALLLSLGAVADDQIGKAAHTAAARLSDAGAPSPRWAAELDEPVTVGESLRIGDPAGAASMLVCSFHRAGRSHACVVAVDHLNCGEARDVIVADGDEVPQVLEMIRNDLRDSGLTAVEEPLEPAELRWQVETALAARAQHDRENEVEAVDDALDVPLFDVEDEPDDFASMAVLLGARLRAMPPLPRPLPKHGKSHDSLDANTALQMMADLLVAQHGARTGSPMESRPRKLPAKRRKADGPAPIYQIKVGLQGAKPPIWRRLEVPADVTLAKLHGMIQAAFDWDGGHMHVFETPYGDFGVSDRELDIRAETSATLEQVAPGAKSKIRYVYDLGDNWGHDILVEKELDRDASVKYPRCTGGRRAAPPDDCGGIWGYDVLVATLADPAHPDHGDMLEWMGLELGAEFDPAQFDVAEINRALSPRR